ncbi:MAG: TRAP transporter large permease subunit [Reyranellaceae bacterium]
MDWNLVFVIGMFAFFIGGLFTGYPLAFVLGGTAVLFALLGSLADMVGIFVDVNFNWMRNVVSRTFGNVMANYGLVSLPMFVFMGHMLDRSGIALKLLRALQLVLARVPGGLAISVTLIGIVLAASTGIIGASVVLLTTLALPTMLEEKYQKELSVGVIAASGTLGILIPPSIMLIVMGDQLNLSVGDLFLGALSPGLLLGMLYLVYVIGTSALRPELAPPMSMERRVAMVEGQGNLWLLLLKALVPPVFLIFAVLGSIFFGIASPTEASGVGAMGATLLAIAFRKLNYRTLKEVLTATGSTTAFIFAAFIGATAFAVVLRGLGGDDVIHDLITGLPFDRYGILIVLLGVIFLLGFFLDWVEIVLIILPLMAPVIPTLDFDPVWFAILVAVCLQTSFLTPPVGFALFYLKAVAPASITTVHIYRGIAMFVVLQLIGLTITILIPDLVLWLPAEAYKPAR